MDETLYKIEFDGTLSEGYAEEEVKNELRNRFKLEEKKISRMFSGDPLILKKGIAKEDAEKFIRSFLNIGVVCTLHPLGPAEAPGPVTEAPPAKGETGTEPVPPMDMGIPETDEELPPLLQVREVLGFIGTGLTNPESEIGLVESAGSATGEEEAIPELVEPVKPDFGEIEPDSGFMEVEKSPGPPGETAAAVEVTLETEPRFRIVFSGHTADDQDPEKIKQSIAELLGIKKKDTNILFSEVPVVLKDNLDEGRAIQYRDQYRNTGAEVIMEPSENLVGGFLIE